MFLKLEKNLISVFLLCKNGFKMVLESDHVVISKNGICVGKGYTDDGMFKLNLDGINEINDIAVYHVDSSTLWHARLAHLGFSSLQYMQKHGYLSIKDDIKKDKCEIFAQAKIIRKPFSKVERNTQLLDLVHSNIYEFNGILTRGGKRYFITFIWYTYVYLLRSKDEAFDAFKHYKSEVENQKERKIKILRNDRGDEYFPDEFVNFCEEFGIIHQKNCPLYSPTKWFG